MPGVAVLLRQGGDRAAPRSVGARQYGAFLRAIFDEWVRRDVGTVFVQAFDVADRDEPVETADLPLLTNVNRSAVVGDHVVGALDRKSVV